MDISALQAFIAVAESGSFSRAGERIFLTQPAVSKRIAALELDIGARLFDRVGRKIHLTQAGEALLLRTRAVLGRPPSKEKGDDGMRDNFRGRFDHPVHTAETKIFSTETLVGEGLQEAIGNGLALYVRE